MISGGVKAGKTMVLFGKGMNDQILSDDSVVVILESLWEKDKKEW